MNEGTLTIQFLIGYIVGALALAIARGLHLPFWIALLFAVFSMSFGSMLAGELEKHVGGGR